MDFRNRLHSAGDGDGASGNGKSAINGANAARSAIGFGEARCGQGLLSRLVAWGGEGVKLARGCKDAGVSFMISAIKKAGRRLRNMVLPRVSVCFWT